MAAAAFLLLAVLAQAPVALKPGQPMAGEITAESPSISTPTLAKDYGFESVAGAQFNLLVEQSGSYTVELRSFAFDAYLIAFGPYRTLLAEDDDGLLATHSRLVLDLEANVSYQIYACALHGGTGPFQIELHSRPLQELPLPERLALVEADWRSRLAYLESIDEIETLLYAEASDGLASVLKELGKYQEVQELYEHALSIREELLGANDPYTAVSLNNLALYLRSIGEYDKAQPLYERSLAIFEDAFGPEDVLTALALENLGMLLAAQGKYSEARALIERSVSIKEKQVDTLDPSLADSYSNLALILQNLDDYTTARHLFEQALQIRTTVSGELHPRTATVLNNFGLLLLDEGSLDEAFVYIERAYKIELRLYGPDHRNMAPTLHNLGLVLDEKGEYSLALEYVLKANEIRQRAHRSEPTAVARTWLTAGNMYRNLGKYSKAREMYERGIALLSEANGPNHIDMTTHLTGLANLLLAQGSHEDALTILQRVLSIHEIAMDFGSLNHATTLSYIAAIHKEVGRHEDAEKLMREVLGIQEQRLGKNSLRVANTLGNIAIIKSALNQNQIALALLERALAIRTKIQGPVHADTATCLSKIAQIYGALGQRDKAVEHNERALEIQRFIFEEGNPAINSSLKNLGIQLDWMGRTDEAVTHYLQSMAGTLDLLDRELPSLTEAERIRWLEQVANPGHLPYALLRQESPQLEEAYSLFLSWKGKATRLLAAGIRLNHANLDGEALHLKGRTQVVAKELATLILKPLAEQADDHAQQISALRTERLTLERELNRLVGVEQVLKAPDLQQVRNGMPENSVLIDFFVDTSVFAWVLSSKGDLDLLDLGNADLLRQKQERFLRQSALRGGRKLGAQETDPGVELLALLWEPLRLVVGDAESIFVCPDGFLGELPLGILQQEDGGYLLEKHRFSYLADPTRLGQEIEPVGEIEGSLFAVGGVNFFRRDEPTERAAGVLSKRSRVGDSWSSLPATRDELQSLQDLHQYILEWQTPLTVVKGKAATEERIRAELPGQRYVHIATHGYFEPEHLPSLLLDAEEKQSKAQLGEQIQAVGMLPGLLSGLVFAGVNGEPDPTRDDGYLSAEEIQHLDLSACDLVVLSACETALGSARAGEGLMSLRRSFSVAGADTVISSLWKVDDIATAQLMKDFYTNLWVKRMSRRDALHEAKLRMLRRNRIDKGGDALPSTWGAFVLSGEWN